MRRSPQLVVSLVLLLGSTLVTTLAFERPALADAATAQAKGHFEAGRAAYLAGDYGKAIAEFQTAQSLKPSPILDYNIGLACEALGDVPHAIEAYRRYLDQKPDASNRPDVEQRIAALQSSAGVAGAAAGEAPNAANAEAANGGAGEAEAAPNNEGYAPPPPVAGTQPAAPDADPYTRGYYAPPAPAPPPVQQKKSRWWIPVVIVGSVLVTVALVAVVVVVAEHNTDNPYAYEAALASPSPSPSAATPPQAPALLRF